ncbi:aldo/keto reductase [Pseudonocardia kujensis]|uniref:aldo/keto reductase n=1 Tax=Pseudonocardia kujensis TaxID=1128675 RepID=UPI001E43C879|nr:aldo/keto reductase [Pseudonocardia kujensis]MCE0765282.1 aldo/keto reductase [Pseudonocardia kujensis]
MRFGRSGVQIGRLGIGAGTQSNVDGERAFDGMLEAAWAHGIRHYDTAPLYLDGESERRLGRFARRHDRRELTVSTKVGRLANRPGATDLVAARRFDYTGSATRESVERSLERLGFDRVDIVYVHDIDSAMHGSGFEDALATVLDECLPALEQLRDAGVIGAIGVSSRQSEVCLRIAARHPVDGFMMAGSYTLLNHEPAERLLPFCLESGQSVVVASPFNTGILASGSAQSTYDYGRPDADVRRRVSAIVAVCAAHGVDISAAALAYPLRHPAVTSVVVGNRSAEEVRINVAAADRVIPAQFWTDLEDAGLIPAVAATGTSKESGRAL